MQFKHPEILWALLLLLIPILIHLLRLRRFKKTPFTNVAMLQKVVSESRKSQEVKKWLLLLSRLLLLSGLIFAFAQPFHSNNQLVKEQETVIYLDNSFSMDAQFNGISLLRRAVQSLVQKIPETHQFSLFTNDRTYTRVPIKQIQEDLLSLSPSSKQLNLDQVQLKAASLFSENKDISKHFVVISDLQERELPTSNTKNDIQVHVVQPLPEKANNIYIDSVYLGGEEENQLLLHVDIIGLKENENLPISLFNGDQLIAKTAVKGSNSRIATSILSIDKEATIKGRVFIEDPVLGFDNQFYFNIDQTQKIKILAISEEEDDFLRKIFDEKEFEFENFQLNNLNYSQINEQNTIIINGLKRIPESLATSLTEFYKNNGTLLIIPSAKEIDFNSYNTFLQGIVPFGFTATIPIEKSIARIAFQHPLFKNVFQKEVTNFDYPKVSSSYSLQHNGSVALGYDDGSPFLVSKGNCFLFTASMAKESNNFIRSPLVVPTLYNIGKLSLKRPSLYQTIGEEREIAIGERLGKDNILLLKGDDSEFIPLQQSFPNKVILQFEENPSKDGIYAVLSNNDTIQNLSFNYPRKESLLNYLEGNKIEDFSIYENIDSVFQTLREDTRITDYWKWFVIFALLFAVLELLIQKLLP